MVARHCGGSGSPRMLCRSVRDFFLAILLLSTISMTILYELSLPWIQRSEKEFRQHIVRSPQRLKSHMDCFASEHRHQNDFSADLKNNRTDVLLKVQQIEDRILGIEASRRTQIKRVTIQGNHDLMEQELPVYEPTLKKYGFVVQVPEWYRGRSSILKGVKSSRLAQPEETQPAMLLLMEDSSQFFHHNNTEQPYQKVNQIPGFVQHLTPADNFCQSVRWAKDNMVIPATEISPPCYVLPDHQEELSEEFQSGSKFWRVKQLTSKTEHKVSNLWENSSNIPDTIRHGSGGRSVIQESVQNPLKIGDSLFVLKVYVLVTAVTPVRAYRHTQGIAQFYSFTGSIQQEKSWSMEQWTEYMYENYGQDSVSQLKHNLHSSITQTLLLANHLMVQYSKHGGRCEGCFQLLEFDMTFNSTFHAFVLEVRGQPRLEHLPSWSAYVSKQMVIQDMVTILSSQSSMTAEVISLIKGMKLEVSIADKGCVNDMETCLEEADIVYLLQSRQESLAEGGFLKLYPTIEGDEYLPVVSRLSALSLGLKGGSVPGLPQGTSHPHHTDLQVHSMLVNSERFYTSMAAEETEVAYDDVNIPLMSQDEKPERKDIIDQLKAPECSKDKSQLPYLTAIHFSPPIKLSPAFQAVTSEYMAVVDYGTYLIQVWAVAKGCNCEARLEEKYGMSRPTNVTLGLGDNKITIFVVVLSHDDPWVINTYSVIVYRKGPAEGMRPFTLDVPHQVCSLKQDCGLRYSPKEPCGLQNDQRFKFWSAFIDNITSLPACQSGDVPGRWFVPCESCGKGSVCYWDEATWQPDTCQHVTLNRDIVRSCFVGKKVLFIGDSTSRGIFHYVAEVVNGTLTEWDKTHNLKVYRNLNNGTTLLGFAYYPQFWLPAERRPVFEDALYQLMKRTAPLHNSSDTVLVVGGVHWLSTHHINVIMTKLQRERLTGIKIIIKGLGSGFHQPVEGLHCLSKPEHQKLLHRNQLVTKYAKDHGFHILETFNMTMSRYKDFLQGKCACHFHRVSPARPQNKSHDKLRGRSQSHGGGGLAKPPRYHVEGEINAVHSEILINTICTNHCTHNSKDR
ncbi:cadherin-like and PC-esterase domain-containing protein 1 [Liolophura sinensis]|uniref:cadherin-like and PC-esterase domain-containing protein 1 n=1 Tax=Liolophura sinensis TaxID=3198878 RepID=UPI0031597349